MTAIAATALVERRSRSRPRELSALDRTCGRLEGLLQHDVQDEISLLRLARVLKTVSNDLILVVRRRAALEGRDVRVARAEAHLETIEDHLRSVLLAVGSTDVRSIQFRLISAVEDAYQVIATLDAWAPTQGAGIAKS